MQLYYYKGFGQIRNFGDELNAIIWNTLIPEILDEDPAELFVGIGTLLNERIPTANRIVIMGSGVGYGNIPSKKQVAEWSIYCLRGKLSAKALGVSMELVATDPAILVHRLFKGNESKTYDFAYMPHWMNMGSSWKSVCDNLGIRLINPIESVDSVILAIKQSKVVIAEAMHGAIVADALRIPWIPVHSAFKDFCPFKWQDWYSSLNIACESHAISRLWHPEPRLDKLRPKAVIKVVLKSINAWMIKKQLIAIINAAKPNLSRDVEFADALRKVEEAINRFRFDCQKARSTCTV